MDIDFDLMLLEDAQGPAGPPVALYHYSRHRLAQILSRRAQFERGMTVVTVEEERDDRASSSFRGDPPYLDSVSLFFDRVPADVIGGVYDEEHVAWSPGGRVWEHVVDARTLGGCQFRVAENPLANLMADLLWSERDALKLAYFRARKVAELARGDRGRGQRALLDAISRYSGRTRDAFARLVASDRFASDPLVRSMYAPTVPHVMVYPDGGVVRVASSSRITIPRERVE